MGVDNNIHSVSYDLHGLSNNMACRVINTGETTSTTDVLEGLSEVFQKAKTVPDEIQKLLMTVNMIPEFKNQKNIQDKETEAVVYCFKLVVEGIFSLAQSCHQMSQVS